jgi:hypothetical protein
MLSKYPSKFSGNIIVPCKVQKKSNRVHSAREASLVRNKCWEGLKCSSMAKYSLSMSEDFSSTPSTIRKKKERKKTEATTLFSHIYFYHICTGISLKRVIHHSIIPYMTGLSQIFIVCY